MPLQGCDAPNTPDAIVSSRSESCKYFLQKEGGGPNQFFNEFLGSKQHGPLSFD